MRRSRLRLETKSGVPQSCCAGGARDIASLAGAGDPPSTAIPSVLRIVLCCVVAVACFAQVSTPLIGYYCDRGGALRPLHGVAGAFVPGPALETDAISAAWSGSAGFAKKERELLLLNADGIIERLEAPPGPATFGFLADGRRAWARFADGSCREFATPCPSANGGKPPLRLRLPETVETYEQLGDGWILVRGKDSLYAIRTHRDNDQAYELPEAEQ